MALSLGIENITDNVAMSFEKIILLIVSVGGLIFYARDFKVGIMLHFVAYALLFVWFYIAGYNWTTPLILCMSFLVILCFTLYAVSSTSPYQGGLL